jgi:transcriptional regulator with XRE-family HTH domain
MPQRRGVVIDANDVLRSIARGESLGEIAGRYQVSISTISRIARANSHRVIARPKPLRPTISEGIPLDVIDSIIRLLREAQEGEQITQADVAERFSLNADQAERACRIATIVIEAKKGASYQEIGDRLRPKMSRERVRQIANKYGLDPQRKVVDERRTLILQSALPLIRKGLTVSEIAKQLLISKEVVADLFLLAQKQRKLRPDRRKKDTGVDVNQLIAAIDEGRAFRSEFSGDVSQRVQLAFLMNGLSSQEVAESLGWRYLQAHHAMIGKRQIHFDEIPDIANALGVSAEWLATGEDTAPAWYRAGMTLADARVQLTKDRTTVRELVKKLERATKGRLSDKEIRLELGIAPINWTRMMRGQVSVRRHYDGILRIVDRLIAHPETAISTKEDAQKLHGAPKPKPKVKPKAKAAAKPKTTLREATVKKR